MLLKKARTEKQIEASRRNGAKSRGPLTPEGKARSSRNSHRHGFRSIDPYAALGDLNIDQTLFDEFKARLIAEYEVQTSDDVSAIESAAYIQCLLTRLRESQKTRLNAEIRRVKRARPELSSRERCALAMLALAEIGFCTTQGRLETRLHVQRFRDFDHLQKLPRKIGITNEPDTSHKTADLLDPLTRAKPGNPAVSYKQETSIHAHSRLLTTDSALNAEGPQTLSNPQHFASRRESKPPNEPDASHIAAGNPTPRPPCPSTAPVTLNSIS